MSATARCHTARRSFCMCGDAPLPHTGYESGVSPGDCGGRKDPGSRGIPLGYAHDLRPLAAVPLAGPATSLHRPPRGTPRIAPGPRLPTPSHRGAPWAEQPRKGGRPPGLHSRKVPAFEDRCIPAGFVARPHRTAVGTPRSCASPVGAHRPSRCTASSGTEPETPGGALREEGQAQTCGFIARRATKRGPPSEDAEAGHDAA